MKLISIGNLICLAAVVSILGCSAQNDIDRFVLLANANHVESLKPSFDALFESTRRAVSNRDVEFLVSTTEFEGSNAGLTHEQASTYYSGIVDSVVSVNTYLTEYKQPRISKSDNSEFGYTYFLSAANSGCRVKFELNFVLGRDSERSEPKLFNIRVVSEKGDCPD